MYAALARGIRATARRASVDAGRRAGQHYSTLACRRADGRDTVLARQEHAGEVDADDLLPNREGHIGHLAVAGRVKDASVGDQHVEPAEPVDHRAECCLDLQLLRDVHGDSDGIPPAEQMLAAVALAAGASRSSTATLQPS